MLLNVFSTHVVTANDHSVEVTNLSIWSKRGVFLFVLLRPQSRSSLVCHSLAHTDTDTQGGGGECRGCVCISGRSSGSFCAPWGPWPVREGGQTGGILSPHAWVGSSSAQGSRREEEMKLLAFVAGLGIKDGGGIKGVPSVRKTSASVQGWAGVGGAGGVGGQGSNFSDKSGIIFPTSAWPWWICCSVTETSGDNSFSPLNHTCVHAPLPPRVVFPVAHVWGVLCRCGFHRRWTCFAAAFPPMKAE